MWRWRYPLIQSLLKAKLQPSLESPWSNSSLLYENYIYSDFQTNTLHPKPIATYYVPSPSVTNQNKNAKKPLLSGMGNNYLLWLMRLLALVMTTPVPFTTNLSSFEQQTTQTNTTLHTSQASNHLLISKPPNRSIITKRHEMLETSNQAGCSATGKIRTHFAL